MNSATSSSLPDLVTLLANFGTQIPPIIILLQFVSALMGLYFVAGSLVEFWGVGNGNAAKYLSAHARFSVTGGVVKLLVGALLAAMSTLQLVGILSRTLTDTYANSRFLSYSPTGNTLEAQSQAAMAALLGIMEIVGFVAMIKGWLTFVHIADGRAQAGYGTATAWLIGGVLAWNFKWLTDVLNCTFGYNVIGMFVSFGAANTCGS
ncbi:MAG: putative type secretion system protein IcmC/DotIE [Gammaproteobacteria bacterium]|nr:putative type secretion system protein IcmC/DotIE [Gammaproteobacteria bacterium]